MVRGTAYEVADAFLDGANMKGHGSIEAREGILYSYNTPIAIKTADGVWVNLESFSVTTSKHQGALKNEMEARSMRPADKYLYAKHLLDYMPGRLAEDDEFQLWV